MRMKVLLLLVLVLSFQAPVARPAWSEDQAQRLMNQAITASNAGDVQEAVRLGELALEEARRMFPPDHVDLATAEAMVAELHRGAGDPAAAVERIERVLPTIDRHAERRPVPAAMTHHDLAAAYFDLGMYAEALEHHRISYELHSRVLKPPHRLLASSLSQQGVVLSSLGDQQGALKLLLKALEQQVALDANSEDTLITMTSIAVAFRRAGLMDEARQAYARVLAAREQNGTMDSIDGTMLLNNIGELERRVGSPTQAIEWLKAACAGMRKFLNEDDPRTTRCATNLGLALMKAGELREAKRLLVATAARQRDTLGVNHPDRADAISGLAELLQTEGRTFKSLRALRQVLAIDSVLIRNVFPIGSDRQRLEIVSHSRRRGTFMAFLDMARRHAEGDARVRRWAMELVLERKGIVFDAESQAREGVVADLDQEAKTLLRRVQESRAALAQLFQSKSPRINADQETARLDEQIERDEAALLRRSPATMHTLVQPRVRLRSVARALPADGVLVEYMVVPEWMSSAHRFGAKRYLAFVLTPDGEVAIHDLGKQAPIDEHIETMLASIEAQRAGDAAGGIVEASQRTDETLKMLYRDLVAPLAPQLGGRTMIFVSPDGELASVPFGALVEANGRYWIETHHVAYLSSGRDLTGVNDDVRVTKDLLLVSNPDYGGAARADDRFAPLRWTEDEAEIVRGFFEAERSTTLAKSDASEERLRAAGAPRVLHIATHGFFDRADDGEQGSDWGVRAMTAAGLALAGANEASGRSPENDGLLTALEVSALGLRGTELVVLSACDSSQGRVRESQGTYGLRRAFALTGARNLVTALWKVDDGYAPDFMGWFYEYFTRQHMSAPVALGRAQRDAIARLRERFQGATDHPVAPAFLWAPYTVQVAGMGAT